MSHPITATFRHAMASNFGEGPGEIRESPPRRKTGAGNGICRRVGLHSSPKSQELMDVESTLQETKGGATAVISDSCFLLNQYIDSGQCDGYLLVHGQIRAGVRSDVAGGC